MVDPAVIERWHDDDNDERISSVTVVFSYQHADATYTAKYIYGVNACREVYYREKVSRVTGFLIEVKV